MKPTNRIYIGGPLLDPPDEPDDQESQGCSNCKKDDFYGECVRCGRVDYSDAGGD